MASKTTKNLPFLCYVLICKKIVVSCKAIPIRACAEHLCFSTHFLAYNMWPLDDKVRHKMSNLHIKLLNLSLKWETIITLIYETWIVQVQTVAWMSQHIFQYERIPVESNRTRFTFVLFTTDLSDNRHIIRSRYAALEICLFLSLFVKKGSAYSHRNHSSLRWLSTEIQHN